MASFIIRHKKAIAVFAVLFPILLNLLVAIPAPSWMCVVGDASDWLLFWATYITALASFTMVIAAYETLLENRKQWIAEHTPKISVGAFQDKHRQIILRICNESTVWVTIQSIQISQEPSDTVKNLFCSVKSKDQTDNYYQWQRLYEHSYMVIRPYEIENVVLLQNFPRQIQEKLSLTIKYNNAYETVKIDLSNIFIIQNE